MDTTEAYQKVKRSFNDAFSKSPDRPSSPKKNCLDIDFIELSDEDDEVEEDEEDEEEEEEEEVKEEVKVEMKPLRERKVFRHQGEIITTFWIDPLTGKKNGVEKNYYPNGQLQYIKKYDQNYLIGIEKYNKRNSQVENECIFSYFAKPGEYLMYHDTNCSKAMPYVWSIKR